VNDTIQADPLPVPPAAISGTSVPEVPATTSLAFTGSRSEFVRLVMRGAFFELITLGFYRFWLATDIRRHLWSNTTAEGDAMEYTGTGKELLIGFLVALAILAPIYLIYFFIGLEAERLQAFASIPLVLFFYLFYQFAMYRARRYRLSRTIWRGVRFWMTGSGWSYAWRAGLWTLLVIITFGLALPWYQAALERYKMMHSHYGDLQGRFDGTGGALFSRYIWFWLGALGLIILMTGFVGYVAPPMAGVLGLGMLIGWPFAYAAYKAIEWRWWASGVRFGDVSFHSRLPASELIGLYWLVIAWSALILTGLAAWFGGIAYLAWITAGGSQMAPEAFALPAQQIPLLIAFAAGYLMAALAFGVVVRIYLRRDVWARVVAYTSVSNLAAAANVAARGDAAGALGEGFADNLDIGGI
jgi:uncharacterized membrane protein YjgN (DUF898 family)